jgi:hypothetical protein
MWVQQNPWPKRSVKRERTRPENTKLTSKTFSYFISPPARCRIHLAFRKSLLETGCRLGASYDINLC